MEGHYQELSDHRSPQALGQVAGTEERLPSRGLLTVGVIPLVNPAAWCLSQHGLPQRTVGWVA